MQITRNVAVAAAVISLTAGLAIARPRAAVYVVAGGKDNIRAKLHNAVANHMEVIEIDGEAVRQGVYGGSVSASKAASIREAGERVGADAVVMARVNQPSRSRQTLRVVVLEVQSGRIVEDRSVTIGHSKRSKKRRRARWVVSLAKATQVLSNALNRVQTAGEYDAPEPEAEAGGVDNQTWTAGSGESPSWASGSWSAGSSGEDSIPQVEQKAERRRSRSSTRGDGMVIVGGSFTMSGRDLAYLDPSTSNLRPYKVLGAPGFAFDATLYPLATRRSIGALQDVGLEASYGQALGLVSSPADATDVVIQTDWRRWAAGAVFRFDFSPLVLRLRAGIGRLEFLFTPEGNFTAIDELPQVRYDHIQGGADFHLALGSFGLLGGAGYLHIFSSGTVGELYFPRSSQIGLQGHVGVTFAIAWGLELRVLGRYTHVDYNLGAQTGDEYVAAGATDRHFGLESGFGLVL